MNATCPKCDGTGNLRAFSHIVSGRCFQCAGSGTVAVKLSEATAAPVSTIPTRDLPGFGRCDVRRDGADFRIQGETGEAIVALRPGRVEVITVSNGWRYRAAELAAVIQARRA
jgi:hypothetical protein